MLEIDRWQAVTCGVAVLAGNGSGFADTASWHLKEARECIFLLRTSNEQLWVSSIFLAQSDHIL
jgi:hypothetical protein